MIRLIRLKRIFEFRQHGEVLLGLERAALPIFHTAISGEIRLPLKGEHHHCPVFVGGRDVV